MTSDELLSEGTRLARPCAYLRTEGTDYCAVWGGMGVVPLRDARFRHWISVDGRALPEGLAMSGCFSVYANQEDCATGLVLVDRQAVLPANPDGEKLYRHHGLSLPPIEAVFRYGSELTQDWLRSQQWRPEWGYNQNFRDRRPAESYLQRYREQVDFKGDQVVAVLGGWHFPWLSGDWAEWLAAQLLVWTLRRSEPWVEVWDDRGRLRVIQRYGE